MAKLMMRITSLVLTIALCCTCTTVYAAWETDKGTYDTTVRAGYVVYGDFDTENGRRSGYGYEYLQKISYYTGWEYEYVYDSFESLLKKLEEGEIDILADVSYNEERAQYIDYSKMEQGQEYYYLYTYKTQGGISNSNLKDLYGKRVGISAGSCQIDVLKDWCEESNIPCEIVEFESTEEMDAALKRGSIAAMVLPGGYSGSDYSPIAMIGRGSFYIAVNKNRPDILESVNITMDEILQTDPYYNERLSQKYSTSSMVVTRTLSDDDMEVIEGYNDIKMGYLLNCMPYCGTDSSTGEVTGLLSDMIGYFNDTYGVGLSVQPYESYQDMTEALCSGEIDISFPNLGDYSIAENTGIMVSESVLSTSMIALISNTKLKDTYKLAISRSDPFQYACATIYHNDDEFVYYDSMEECLDAVLSGSADYTIIESAKINEIGETLDSKKIQKIDLREDIDVSFAVNHGNTQLLAILNKCILAVDDSIIYNSLISNSQKNNTYTASDFIKEYIVLLFLIVVLVFGFIIAILVSHFISMNKSKKQITSARYEASHDALTGLLNRASYLDVAGRLRESDKPVALLVVDVDKFKDINDNYGHQIGDKALVRVATLLTQGFRSEDYIIRYAGDEFVVIMNNFSASGKHLIGTKLDKINSLLQIPAEDVPKLSISVGIAFSERGFTESLFINADSALYQAKEKGRCGYSFY